MSKLARSFLPIVVLLSCAAGCASGVAELRTDQSCRVWIEQPFGGTLAVTVYNGEGFTPEAAQKAPAPFYTTRNVGLGLGLTVSRKTIGSHRGRLEIPPPRAGSHGVVRVLLPVDAPPPPA